MWYTEYLKEAEAEAKKATESPMHLADLIDACRAVDAIRTSSSIKYQRQYRPITGEPCMDIEMARDGALKNAKPEIIRFAARWRVDPDQIEKITAELMNTTGTYSQTLCGLSDAVLTKSQSTTLLEPRSRLTRFASISSSSMASQQALATVASSPSHQ
jgi:hypothetical protein